MWFSLFFFISMGISLYFCRRRNFHYRHDSLIDFSLNRITYVVVTCMLSVRKFEFDEHL